MEQTQDKLLKNLEEKFGVIPNVFSVYLNNPAATVGILTLVSGCIGSEKLPLSRDQCEIMIYHVAGSTGSEYVKAFHQKLYDEAVQKVPKEEQEFLIEFAISISNDPNAAASYKEKFVSRGYSEDQFKHAVLVTSTSKFFSTYTNALEVKIDDYLKK